jgi:hypothetical protein
MPDNWSREEVEAAVADYFDMLSSELHGEAFNKAEHNRNLQRMLVRRSKGSVARKHQNISAILLELGYPYVDGYKPLSNYQELLRSVVVDRLSAADSLQGTVAAAVELPAEAVPSVDDVLSIQVDPPVREGERPLIYEKRHPPAPTVRRNYLEVEARNRSLGRAGEELVLRFEHERLWRAGKKKLAERIEHVARTKGDYLGYDILSFEASGQERLIEVKTTAFGALTPFFASRNEVNFSESRDAEYQLYRLYNFRRQPKLFSLGGAISRTCSLVPVQFSATPR